MTTIVFEARALLRILLLLLLVAAPAAPAAEPGVTSRQQEILQTTLSAEGWLTPSMHEAFWADISADLRTDPKLLEAWRSFFAVYLETVLAYQLEFWTSLEATLAAGRRQTTPDYDRLRREMESGPFADAPAYRQALANADRMFEAAATGTAVVVPHGSFLVTPELITTVKSGLAASMVRARRLVEPVWQAVPELYDVPDAHLRLLWSEPPQLSVEPIDLGEFGAGRMYGASTKPDASIVHQVAFTEFPADIEDWERILRAALRGVFDFMGATPVGGAAQATSFRGRVSVHQAARARFEGYETALAIRTVAAPEHRGYWLFLALVDGGSPAEASLQLDDLLQTASFVP